MKSKRGLFLSAIVVAFLAGAALPTIVLWNPARWEWADRLVRRGSGPEMRPVDKAGKQLWTCGMHPQVIQDHPGNCPICGMKLVPLKGAPPAGAGEHAHEGADSTVTGVRVDPTFIQNFAVRSTVVEKGSIPVEINTIGVLAYNEKNIVSVNTKFEGWIEKAIVNYVGEPVRKGQVLFEIYSPQLVTTQQEYLAAVDYLERLSSSSYPNAAERARSLLEATRERLRYWDITDDQIAELRRNKKITRALKILSPVAGVVVEKMGDSLEGMKLTPGMNVYKIADLSNLWAGIEVYEYQIQHLRLGQGARITVDAFPGRRWTGRIIYLDPAVNPQTRTLKAYVEIPNPGGKLRPQMYANVEIRVPAVSGTVKVPSEAIIHSGERSVVIVQKAKGIFEPREVALGLTGGGYTEVRHGLRPGETIVTSSQFLIDSESNLKEAISKMLAGSEREGEQPAAAPPVHQH